ncbi:hypothetical protein ACFRAU_07510 [Arthrobacter sp. NPDC056691]|uniref:hypothetical protein n=1 Tax=Arthrobacter sp. NPDC056691 TaxID=3345913 RepID=UPI003672F08F
MTATASFNADAGIASTNQPDADLLALTLNVSADQTTWHSVVFEGESAAYVDHQATAYLRQRPYLAVELGEELNWGMLPRTFNAVFKGITRNQQLLQVQTL